MVSDMTSGSLSIACAQFRPVLGDVPANRDRILALHAEAMSRGAEIVLTPELGLTGYFLRDLAPEVSIALDSEELQPLSAATIDGPDLIASFVEQRDDYRRCISAVHWHDGEVQHVHRKVYLPTYGMFEDERYFATGDRCAAYDAPQGRAGMLICEDWLHPILPTILALDGAHLLFGVSASPDQGFREGELDNLSLWRQQLTTYAALLGCGIAWCNRVGFEDGVHFGGCSLICDASGQVVAEGHAIDEEIVMGTLDLGAIRRARVKAPVLETENIAMSLRELERIQQKGWEAIGDRINPLPDDSGQPE